MEQIKVLIADDMEMAREGLQRLLADTPDITVVGQASTHLGAVELAGELRPDVVLRDLN